MAGRSHHTLGALSLAILLASSSTALAQEALAQEGRIWVDPPSEGSAPPQIPASSGDKALRAKEPPPPSPAVPGTPSLQAKQNEPTSSPDSDAKPSVSARQAVPDGQKRSGEQIAAERRKHSPSAATASAKKRKTKEIVRRTYPATTGSIASSRSAPRSVSERRTRLTRSERIRQGVDSGLEIMNLQTIQLPDGRRIKVLTRPDQETVSELLAESYR